MKGDDRMEVSTWVGKIPKSSFLNERRGSSITSDKTKKTYTSYKFTVNIEEAAMEENIRHVGENKPVDR